VKSLDVSTLPSYRYGHHSLMWWGMMGLIAIEGMVFVLGVMAYFYLWSQASTWPLRTPAPDLLWGSLNVAIFLASVWPNHWTKRAAEDGDEAKMRAGLAICALFGIVLIAVRVLEFTALNVRWDTDAYGSLVWIILGLHTTHLVTDVFDTFVLLALMFTGPMEGRRHVDVAENAMYWYFVVWGWLPIYAVLYWMPRLG